jgi:hypothetical protein
MPPYTKSVPASIAHERTTEGGARCQRGNEASIDFEGARTQSGRAFDLSNGGEPCFTRNLDMRRRDRFEAGTTTGGR